MGFLGDFIGGAAGAGAEIIGNQIKEDQTLERQKQLAQMNSELEAERQKTIQQARLQLEEEQRVAKQKRVQGELEEAEKGGEEIRRRRDLATANERAPSLDQEGMGMIRKSLSDAEMEKYYGVKKPTAVDIYDDQIAAARGAGALDALEPLRKGRSDARTEERDAAKDALEEKRLQQQRDIADQRDETQNRRIEALAKTGGTTQGNGTGAERLEITKAREKRLDLQKRIDVTLKKVEGGLMTRKEGREKIDELEKQQARYDQIIDEAPESTKKDDKATGNVGKSSTPPAVSSVKGAPSGSSIGVLVSGKGWEVKDAKGKVIGYAKE